jgi:cellulose synthase/poly-beta-1,6-N-acetylglucosamine synthase-like glycosyltransferase
VILFIKNRNTFVEKDLKSIFPEHNIIFQITTRSATKTDVVRRGVQSILDSAREINYKNYQISVITDDPNDIRTLVDIPKCKVVVVDKNFRTSAIKKGKALQYAVEHRRSRGENTAKYWIFHMDDESYVTPQTIKALLKSIDKGDTVASEGPIFYPLKFEAANRLTAIAESMRPFACYDCVSQMTNPPPMHMHGSNLLVRSDVEDTIGWNFGPTLAEDQMFGFKVYERYGRNSMGWHGGILLEQPPLNIKDHFMQRRRWVLGSLQNMDKFPRFHKYKLMFKSVTYFLGFASAMSSTTLFIHNYYPKLFAMLQTVFQGNAGGIEHLSTEMVTTITGAIGSLSTDSLAHSIASSSLYDVGVGTLLLFTSIVWLASYQVGLLLNLRYSKISFSKRVLMHLQTFALCPLIGLVETFPAFWAMIEHYIRKTIDKTTDMPVYDFYVVAK